MNRAGILLSVPLVLLALSSAGRASGDVPPCPLCPVWNASQQPFRIYGNTYYVGVHGLSAILITSNEGHVLIDGGLPQSAASIVASIRSLGFRVEDVKLVVNSHVHFDHAGGIAEIQRLTAARVAASAAAARILTAGGVGRDDPQYGILAPIAPVARVSAVKDGETLHVGPIALSAHLTPGHTPGGTSWTWQSCEADRCLNIVYADSLSPLSADGFLFTRSSEYPSALKDYEKSFAALSALPCDIRLTPHPDASGLLGKLEQRERGGDPNAFIDPNSCRTYVEFSREALRKRVAAENARHH
jgi:metallo-beta-lactamase class B